ncbi:hypothetical protein GV64_11255 [Endozoicomonas elysicola]|uniref:Uncharacterized protein n=1 Tax=Endozoicomonas elysicola TaxID=305900 RepID=A0A081KAR6_9GAMM|nr:hypothetical protein GV64_11255 [Endozoicomonas elysicola]
MGRWNQLFLTEWTANVQDATEVRTGIRPFIEHQFKMKYLLSVSFIKLETADLSKEKYFKRTYTPQL